MIDMRPRLCTFRATMARPSRTALPAADTAPGIAPAATRATSLTDELRNDLLDGVWRPGSKLAIEALAERYATSATPLREALNRLIADGLVERREQRGFAVAGISAADLEEITRTRCWLEETALRESIRHRDVAWEEGLVLALHRLQRTPRSASEAGYAFNPEWETMHRAFHRALISGCRSRWLLGFCEQLTDQHQRYRRLAASRSASQRPVLDEHRAICDAALAGQADEAVALLQGHYRRTAAVLLTDGGLFAAAPPRTGAADA
ncbi:MAG: hypothetical protein RIQ53_173 [Pseudomonadota bacterium]